MERRKFLSLVTAAAGAATAALIAVPLVGHFFEPLRRKSRPADEAWIPIGSLEQFPQGLPQRVSVPVPERDGWEMRVTNRAAWVVRAKDDTVVVFTSVCPHLGCSVKWAVPASQFECPCHASGFALDGARTKGPARRGLDALPSRLVAGRVEIRWQDYTPNIAECRPVGAA
jgi:Rieske Fe-S protein